MSNRPQRQLGLPKISIERPPQKLRYFRHLGASDSRQARNSSNARVCEYTPLFRKLWTGPLLVGSIMRATASDSFPPHPGQKLVNAKTNNAA
jgi:hypothetical protein